MNWFGLIGCFGLSCVLIGISVLNCGDMVGLSVCSVWLGFVCSWLSMMFGCFLYVNVLVIVVGVVLRCLVSSCLCMVVIVV